MIAVPMIDWQPIEAMPEDRKDGRQVLLWINEAVVARWARRRSHEGDYAFWNGHFFSEIDGQSEPVEDVTYWADINRPE